MLLIITIGHHIQNLTIYSRNLKKKTLFSFIACVSDQVNTKSVTWMVRVRFN